MQKINCFTAAERAALLNKTKSNIRISLMKWLIASSAPEDEWDDLYVAAYSVFTAMVNLAKHTTSNKRPWVWAAKDVPLRYHAYHSKEEARIYPIACSAEDASSVESILNRPAQLLDFLARCLGPAAEEEFGIVNLQLDLTSVDVKGKMAKLSWKLKDAPVDVVNEIYLPSGVDKRMNSKFSYEIRKTTYSKHYIAQM